MNIMKRSYILIAMYGLFLTSCNIPSPEEHEQDKLIRAGDRVNAAGDSTAAINVYKSALEKNPPHKLPIYLKLGEAYMNADMLDDAKKVYEEALPFDENDEIKKQLGRLYIATGQSDEAIAILEGVILIHKDDIRALNGLGVAHDIKKEHNLAQNYYRKALSINPDNEEIKSNLGLSLAFEGRYDEAVAILQPIGDALGATSKQRHNLALVYGLAGNQSKAHELYSKDLDTAEINKNIQAFHLISRPKLSPQREIRDHSEIRENWQSNERHHPAHNKHKKRSKHKTKLRHKGENSPKKKEQVTQNDGQNTPVKKISKTTSQRVAKFSKEKKTRHRKTRIEEVRNV